MSNDIKSFIESLKNSHDFKNQIVYHRVLPARPPVYGTDPNFLNKEITGALGKIGIKQLYSHQFKSIKAVRDGKNVILSTPTSSGKTLTYNVPVVESILSNEHSRALYLFPLKALGQDQLKTLREFVSKFSGRNIRAEIYDGDTPRHKRRKIAQVLRRLCRICSFYSSNTCFITCSATISNPSQFAETLTGLPCISPEPDLTI